jgi:thiamine-phosphate pyrophosphorylase
VELTSAGPIISPVGDLPNTKVLRLLDANANRAREALRVLEDYTRFVLDDDSLCSRLKHLRHDTAAVTAAWGSEAILHRDTPGDVGTTISTTAEQIREDLDHVVIAAAKRFGEALRALEEYSKTFSPSDAAKLESVRYRFYDIEQSMSRTLRPDNLFGSVKLYVLITQSACRRPWRETAEAAIRGGADALQLREKDLESGDLLHRAKALVMLCRNYNVLAIINDRPDIAVLSNADGVHVGQGDLPAIEARKIVGHKKIVGVSTHEIAQAKRAVLDGVDYIGVGPIFRSSTKPRDWAEIPGLEFAKQVAEQIRLPAVAIAGINAENLSQVTRTGITAIAVTAAVTGSDDVESSARLLKTQLTRNSDV